MKRGSAQRRLMAIGCALTAAVLAARFFIYPRDRLLPQRARPVIAVDISMTEGPPRESVYWLSPDRLLIITTDVLGRLPDRRWQGHADLYVLPEQTRTRLAGLTYLFNHQTGGALGAPEHFKVSPNGTWLYWQGPRFGENAGWSPSVSTFDARRHREWDDELGWPRFWSDDNHYALVLREEFEVPMGVMIRDARNSKGDQEINASSSQVRDILQNYSLSHPLSEENIPIDSLHSSDGPLPKDATLLYRFDSPTEDATIYQLHINEAPLLVNWMHRLFPPIVVKPTVSEGLWLTDPNTHHLQEIGRVPGINDLDGEVLKQLHQIQWLPDGKRVSFIYRGMLYVVDATAPLER